MHIKLQNPPIVYQTYQNVRNWCLRKFVLKVICLCFPVVALFSLWWGLGGIGDKLL